MISTKPKTVFILFPLLCMILLSIVNVGGLGVQDRNISVYSSELDSMVNDGWEITNRLKNEHENGAETIYNDNAYIESAEEFLTKTENDLTYNNVDNAFSNLESAKNDLEVFLDSEYTRYVQSQIRDFLDRYSNLKDSYQEVSSWGGGFFNSISGKILFISLLLGLVAFVILLSIRILGSGIAGESISIIVKLLMFIIVWFSLSGGSWSLILDITLVGKIIWSFLTFIYFFGVLLNLK